MQQVTNENIKTNVLEGKLNQTKENISRKRSRGVLTDVTLRQNIYQSRVGLKQLIKNEEQKQLPRAKRIRLSITKNDNDKTDTKIIQHSKDVDNKSCTDVNSIDGKEDLYNTTTDKPTIKSSQESTENKDTIINKDKTEVEKDIEVKKENENAPINEDERNESNIKKEYNLDNDKKRKSIDQLIEKINTEYVTERRKLFKKEKQSKDTENLEKSKLTEEDKNKTENKRKKSIFEEEIEKAQAKEENSENDEVEEEYPEKAREQDWDDLDAEDEFDPIMVSEYVNDIFNYLKEKEISTKPDPESILEVNKELTWKMRTSLVDWIIQLHYAFKFCLETLYLTINIVDRFLSVHIVPSAHLPLVGIAALFIAAKYEEIIVPSVEQILKAANNCNIPEEVFIVERCILRELEFDLNYPSPLNFLRRISKADDYEMFGRTLSKFFMELSLLNSEFLNYLPSKITAASMYLSRIMLDRPEWTPNLRHYSGYHEDELKECVSLLIQSLASPPKKWNRSVLDKYALPKFGKVSLFAREWLRRNIEKAEELIV